MTEQTITETEAPAIPEIPEQKKTPAEEYAVRLRAMARWLDQHPDVPIHSFEELEITYYPEYDSAEKRPEREVIAAVAKAIGKGKKDYSGSMFKLIAETPEGTSYTLYANREKTCERVVVGTEEKKIPATEAIPAKPERTELVEKVEWRCTGILDPKGLVGEA